MKCTNCNHDVNAGAAFCGNCGAPLQPPPNPAPYTAAPNPVVNQPSDSPLQPQAYQQYASYAPQPPPAYNAMPQGAVTANQIPEVMSAAKTTVIASAIMLGLNVLLVLVVGFILFIALIDRSSGSSDSFSTYLILAIAGVVLMINVGVWIWLINLGQQLKRTTSTALAAKLVERLFIITIVIIVLSILSSSIPIAAIIMIISIGKAKDTLARTPLS